MDINNLIDIFKSETLKTRPDLNDFSKGSILYTLSRAFSAVALQTYVEIDNLKKSSILSEEYIDASVLGSIAPSLQRRQGSLAQGKVLILNLTNSAVVIPEGTTLTEVVNSVQFITTANVTVSPSLETTVDVIAVDIGSEYNLTAGTSLININYPRLVFTVGEFRNIDNTISGGFSGGLNLESNRDYINRLKDRILNLRITQQQVLIDYLMSKPDITNVTLNLIRGGLLLIWIKSKINYTDVQLETLNNEINDLLPLGVYSQIKQFSIVNLTVKVQVFDETTVVIDNLIIDLINNYVNNLPSDSTLNISSIRNIISERLGIVVKIIEPLNNIKLEDNQLFQLNNIEVINAF